MKTLRAALGLPIVILGTLAAWIALATVRLGYKIGGEACQFDPLGLELSDRYHDQRWNDNRVG